MSVCISFVVPAFNEQRDIEACLSSICSRIERYELQAEVIVVDNGSTDNTATLARQYTENVYSIDKRNVSYARNYGARQASHALIAFVDGDVEITDCWVERIVARHKEFSGGKMFVTGYQCKVPENGSWIHKHWFANLTDKYLGGANIITSFSTFELLGGFNEHLDTGEDYDFCLRAISSQEVEYKPDAEFEAIHLGFPADILNFYRREVWHGLGDASSISSFFKSKVLMLAAVYLLFVILLVCFVLIGEGMGFILTTTLFIFFNFLVTFMRFRQSSYQSIIYNSFLHPIYFFARIVSFFK